MKTMILTSMLALFAVTFSFLTALPFRYAPNQSAEQSGDAVFDAQVPVGFLPQPREIEFSSIVEGLR